MSTKKLNQTSRQVQSGGVSPLAKELAEAAGDQTQWAMLTNLLRAATRSVLDASVTMRHEPIEPYERALAYAGRQVAYVIGDEPIHADYRYLMGRIDALLDLCSMSIDRSISEALVAEVRRRSRALDILQHLVRQGESRAGELADMIGIKPNHLSNVLHWMEAADLVRRASTGRTTIVSLGPKGEAVYSALLGESRPQLAEDSTATLIPRAAQANAEQPDVHNSKIEFEPKGEVATALSSDSIGPGYAADEPRISADILMEAIAA